MQEGNLNTYSIANQDWYHNGIIDEIRIISAQGIEIHSLKADEIGDEISIDQIPSGLYILMIRSDGLWVTKKFIKQ